MLPVTPKIEMKVLDSRLQDWGLPCYQSDMAAAVDLFACLDETISVTPQAPARLISSGFALGMGNGHLAALILPRSGLGHKKGLIMGNSLGLIDADYLGEVMISVWNRNPIGTDAIEIHPGDRIAQMMFVPVVRPNFDIVADFSQESARGAGGFGSTGG